MKTKNKAIVLAEIAIVLCSVFLVALPAIAADQTTQKTITTASEDDFTLGIYGNANEDDTIDMRDTTYIKLVIFGKKPKTDLADANYDGKISMLDVGQTKLIILGKEKKLTLIDLADRTVTIDKPVERVVMTFNFEEPISVDGKDIFKKIVGWNRGYWEGRRPTIWKKYTTAFPEIDDIPDVGYPNKGTFSAEKVITLKPGIVIATTSVDLEHIETAVEQLEQAGIPTIFMDYHTETIETHAKSTLMLGYVFDKEERAQEIMDFYTEQIDKVYSRLDEVEGKPKLKVYIEWNKWRTLGNTMDGKLVEKIGGINIAKEVVKEWGEISPEYVLDAKPDVFIISATSKALKMGYYAPKPEELRESMKEYCDRPGWDTLSFTKNQRIYAHNHGLGRHIYDFVVVQHFAKCFYPEEFDDLDPEENFKEFHERFLPVDYSGVWMLPLEE
jgi:iron complex transport system substrate-binding protein